MKELMHYLKHAVEQEASDLFLIVGSPACQKCDGRVAPIDDERLSAEDTKNLITEIYRKAERSMDEYLTTGDDDFSFAVPGLARFRVNTYRQRGSMSAVIRVVSFQIPDWKTYHIAEEVMDLADVDGGMVIVTGRANSGKSTTQACIIDRINHTRECHIITLEDPIEYLHRNGKSLVSQREIAIDTRDYGSALRACMRQAPDVILLGEMRDAETISAAITAAETGHTIITTLHTGSAVHTIDRIIDSFPSQQQGQIRVQLASVLHTVVAQQLIPDVNGNLIPAYEIMHMNSAIRTLIRDNKNHQIDNVIASSGAEGMVSMDQYILRLYREGTITEETALEYAVNEEQMKRSMRKSGERQ
ncbi:MAG: PilT/PilU family type 4a pilus ATPase [Firmicutes bacterium]|nr:PilT/PilU family type 4a pilus ATPase [Bacillota bacterium]